MRALPGSESRIAAEPPPAFVTRETAYADQRRRMLRAIGELVGRSGWSEVTIELIAKRAHVSFRTFYKHFPDKDACFEALFDEVFASTELTIREQLAQQPQPWPERVKLVLGALIELLVAEPLIARAMIVESPTVGPAFDGYERAFEALTRLFAEGRTLSLRGAVLPSTVEGALAGSVFWSVYQRLLAGEAERLPEVLPEIAALVFRTYLGHAEATRLARTDARLQGRLAPV